MALVFGFWVMSAGGRSCSASGLWRYEEEHDSRARRLGYVCWESIMMVFPAMLETEEDRIKGGEPSVFLRWWVCA